MRLLVCILSFSFQILVSAQKRQNANSTSHVLPTNTGYYCQLRCVAKCTEEQKVSNSLDNCSSFCAAYHNQHLCDAVDLECWSRCKDLFNDTGDAPRIPDNVTVVYTSEPHPNPHEADLRWAQVHGAVVYVIQYAERIQTMQKWNEDSGNITITSVWHFKKPQLCAQYAFRIAAVNRYGVSAFSQTVVLAEPTPAIEKPSYNLTSIELLNTPFNGVSPNDPSYNSTVRLVVSYAPPTGWDLEKEIIRVEPYFHAIELQVATGQPVAPYIRHVEGTARFEILLPGDVAYTDWNSEALFGVEKLYTTCNPETPFEYPKDEAPFLFLSFNCADVKGGLCPAAKAIPPDCNLDWAKPSFQCINGSLADAIVHFSNTSKNNTVLYYAAMYGTLNRHQDGSPVPILLPWGESQLIIVPSNESSFSLSGLPINAYYETSICAIFDSSTESAINWNITRRFPIDMAASSASICAQESSSGSTVAVLVISVALVLLISLIILACFYAKMRRRQTKTLAELARLDKNGVLDGTENGYVDMPRLYDRWEIPRSQLVIYEDQKLGSGAFGAVYKGKIRGKALMSKNAQSILAENWMAAEDCDVAVKMLPEYADEGAKSEFRKEINLMKQLGHHERLLNMLCCTTAEEPLCLIVEYCSEGDLLHYLRDRCKYMVKLQEQGIDLSDLPENYDIDLNYILSLKDLLMFSWQICVGLEYLSEKNYIHRDVAARNVMVATGKRAKIGDFGLCRYSCSDPIYMGKGGRLPWKWMALEAIKDYEFTTKSDVWSFGVLLFEIVTLGGSPYPGIDPSTMEKYLDDGNRLAHPDNCPDDFFGIMQNCWNADPEKRPTFTELREQLSKQLETITEDYSYLHLNQSRDYYNMSNHQYNTRQQYPSSFASICDDRFEGEPSQSGPTEATVASTSFVNPSFESDQERRADPGQPKHAAVTKSKSFPFHWSPNSRRISDDSGITSDSTSVISDDHNGQGFEIGRRLCRESAGSDQMLLTSPQHSGTKLPKFFKLRPALTVDRLDTLPESSAVFSTDDKQGRTVGAVNPVYMEQLTPAEMSITATDR